MQTKDADKSPARSHQLVFEVTIRRVNTQCGLTVKLELQTSQFRCMLPTKELIRRYCHQPLQRYRADGWTFVFLTPCAPYRPLELNSVIRRRNPSTAEDSYCIMARRQCSSSVLEACYHHQM